MPEESARKPSTLQGGRSIASIDVQARTIVIVSRTLSVLADQLRHLLESPIHCCGSTRRVSCNRVQQVPSLAMLNRVALNILVDLALAQTLDIPMRVLERRMDPM